MVLCLTPMQASVVRPGLRLIVALLPLSKFQICSLRLRVERGRRSCRGCSDPRQDWRTQQTISRLNRVEVLHLEKRGCGADTQVVGSAEESTSVPAVSN